MSIPIIIQEKTYETIGKNSTRRVNKKELIDLINKTFDGNNDYCDIAIITTTHFGDYDNPIVMQSVTFGKPLED